MAIEKARAQNLFDTLLASVGGGGLTGGIGAWFAGTSTRVIGVEPELAPTLTAALEAGFPVDAPAGGIAADSLAPRRVGEHPFPILRQHLAQVLLVADDDIQAAQLALWDRLRVVVEPGGPARCTGHIVSILNLYSPGVAREDDPLDGRRNT
jgi:threonine dehydratase